jgi:hypothetical protein
MRRTVIDEPSGSRATARQLTITAADIGTVETFQLPELAPGWYMFQSRDAFVTLNQRNSRVGLDASGEQIRSWRLGPASRALVHVIYRSRFDANIAGILAGVTVNGITGLQENGTAAPSLTISEYSIQDAQDTRTGWLAYDDGSGLLSSRGLITNGQPAICYPPGWSRRGEIRSTGLGLTLDIFDGTTQLSMMR